MQFVSGAVTAMIARESSTIECDFPPAAGSRPRRAARLVSLGLHEKVSKSLGKAKASSSLWRQSRELAELEG